jgi:3-dehydroquinate synthase
MIALGGGVVGDLTGFIASIYKRGIPYIQIPTTLLAQVDSSIGGKTAIDLKEGKNLVGTFYQPRLVVTDITVLQSLPKTQIKSGLAEIIKYALIADEELFSFLERHLADIFAFKTAFLEHIISRCCAIKARIVSRDEREEKGIRTILNFGHTIAHAIENASGYTRYNHGQAVALGMLVAGEMSKILHLLHPETFSRLERLIRNAGLPTEIKYLTHSEILQAHYYDKKFIGKKNRFVLAKDIGRTEVISGIPLSVISSAIKRRT